MFDPMHRARGRRTRGVSMRYHCRFDGFAEHPMRVVAQATDLRLGAKRSTIARALSRRLRRRGELVRNAAGIELEGTRS